jgi:phosphoglycolate phosphatase
VKLAILSADTDDLVQKFVQNHQLQSYFTATLGLEPDGLNKPNPRLYQNMCDRVGVNPENTVIVGDSGYDWQMGRAAGAGVIGIRWGNVAAVPAKAVDVAIADLAEIAVEQE